LEHGSFLTEMVTTPKFDDLCSLYTCESKCNQTTVFSSGEMLLLHLPSLEEWFRCCCFSITITGDGEWSNLAIHLAVVCCKGALPSGHCCKCAQPIPRVKKIPIHFVYIDKDK
jgi:hypothetical protein